MNTKKIVVVAVFAALLGTLFFLPGTSNFFEDYVFLQSNSTGQSGSGDSSSNPCQDQDYQEYGSDEPCATPHVDGCMTYNATNFNRSATRDDGSCKFDKYGCMKSQYDNYDPAATKDGGNCSKTGCTNPEASNHDPIANLDDGSCNTPLDNHLRNNGGHPSAGNEGWTNDIPPESQPGNGYEPGVPNPSANPSYGYIEPKHLLASVFNAASLGASGGAVAGSEGGEVTHSQRAYVVDSYFPGEISSGGESGYLPSSSTSGYAAGGGTSHRSESNYSVTYPSWPTPKPPKLFQVDASHRAPIGAGSFSAANTGMVSQVRWERDFPIGDASGPGGQWACDILDMIEQDSQKKGRSNTYMHGVGWLSKTYYRGNDGKHYLEKDAYVLCHKYKGTNTNWRACDVKNSVWKPSVRPGVFLMPDGTTELTRKELQNRCWKEQGSSAWSFCELYDQHTPDKPIYIAQDISNMYPVSGRSINVGGLTYTKTYLGSPDGDRHLYEDVFINCHKERGTQAVRPTDICAYMEDTKVPRYHGGDYLMPDGSRKKRHEIWNACQNQRNIEATASNSGDTSYDVCQMYNTGALMADSDIGDETALVMPGGSTKTLKELYLECSQQGKKIQWSACEMYKKSVPHVSPKLGSRTQFTMPDGSERTLMQLYTDCNTEQGYKKDWNACEVYDRSLGLVDVALGSSTPLVVPDGSKITIRELYAACNEQKGVDPKWSACDMYKRFESASDPQLGGSSPFILPDGMIKTLDQLWVMCKREKDESPVSRVVDFFDLTTIPEHVPYSMTEKEKQEYYGTYNSASNLDAQIDALGKKYFHNVDRFEHHDARLDAMKKDKAYFMEKFMDEYKKLFPSSDALKAAEFLHNPVVFINTFSSYRHTVDDLLEDEMGVSFSGLSDDQEVIWEYAYEVTKDFRENLALNRGLKWMSEYKTRLCVQVEDGLVNMLEFSRDDSGKITHEVRGTSGAHCSEDKQYAISPLCINNQLEDAYSEKIRTKCVNGCENAKCVNSVSGFDLYRSSGILYPREVDGDVQYHLGLVVVARNSDGSVAKDYDGKGLIIVSDTNAKYPTQIDLTLHDGVGRFPIELSKINDVSVSYKDVENHLNGTADVNNLERYDPEDRNTESFGYNMDGEYRSLVCCDPSKNKLKPYACPVARCAVPDPEKEAWKKACVDQGYELVGTTCLCGSRLCTGKVKDVPAATGIASTDVYGESESSLFFREGRNIEWYGYDKDGAYGTKICCDRSNPDNQCPSAKCLPDSDKLAWRKACVDQGNKLIGTDCPCGADLCSGEVQGGGDHRENSEAVFTRPDDQNITWFGYDIDGVYTSKTHCDHTNPANKCPCAKCLYDSDTIAWRKACVDQGHELVGSSCACGQLCSGVVQGGGPGM